MVSDYVPVVPTVTLPKVMLPFREIPGVGVGAVGALSLQPAETSSVMKASDNS